jgi:hypothetical protein
MKCFACGVEKDMAALEVSKWAEEDGLCDEPIEPLHVIECQSITYPNIFKATVICLECHHKLQPDMWISEPMWIALNPVIPFDRLPMPHDKAMWNPEFYKEVS